MWRLLNSANKSLCRNSLWAAGLFLVLLSSCLKSEDFSNLELQPLKPTLAFALLSTQVSSDDLVGLLDSAAAVEADGVFRLRFEAERFIQSTDDLLPALDFNLPIPIVDTLTTIPLPTLLGFQVSRAELTGESVVFTFNSDIRDTVILTVEVPVLEREGEVFSKTFILDPASGPFSSFTSDPISIAGYTLDLSSNTLQLRYTAITGAGERVRLPLSFVQITGLDFGFVQGGLGRIAIPSGLQAVPFDLPDSLLSGDIGFLRPELKFSITNSIGIPIAVRALQLYVTNSDGSVTNIESSLFQAPIAIDFPSLAERGATVRQEIVLDNSNSNLADVLTPSVRELAYEVEVIANPDDSQRLDYFLTDTSAASLLASLEVPLDVNVGLVNINYALPVQIDTIEDVTSLRLKLFVDNGIPLAFAPKIGFTGPGTSISLAEENGSEIRAAQTNDDGSVAQSEISELFFDLPGNQLDQLANVDSVRLQLTLRSSDGLDGRVQIAQDQVMKVGMGVEIEL